MQLGSWLSLKNTFQPFMKTFAYSHYLFLTLIPTHSQRNPPQLSCRSLSFGSATVSDVRRHALFYEELLKRLQVFIPALSKASLQKEEFDRVSAVRVAVG